jgi:CheY-like chemotaxis protein
MKKILIIEDDPVASLALQRLLEANGYEVDAASNGAKGLDRLLAFEPDAVLLDLLMPTLGGFIVLKTIRGDRPSCQMPVLVLTSNCTPEFEAKALAAGANHVLDKSKVAPAEILSLLGTELGAAPTNRVAAFRSSRKNRRY